MPDTNDNGNDDQGLVKPEWACPLCGERRVDFLIIHDEDKAISDPTSDVTCSMCGTQYRI